MPWFPEFVSAVELARVETRAAGHADPVGEYLTSLSNGDYAALEDSWPGDIVVLDPRAGEIRGPRHLRKFVASNRSWMAEHHVRTEVVASTRTQGRAVVELLAHLADGGRDWAWPIAVVAESADEESVMFRTYCSQWPVDGRRHVRPPILPRGREAPGDVVSRHQSALDAGDVEAVLRTFAPDAYLRSFAGPRSLHRGTDELRAYFADCFSAGGGIDLETCVVTDDGVRCVVEYNCLGWGSQPLQPQAGVGVYERSPDGLLAAARIYDDIKPPFESELLASPLG